MKLKDIKELNEKQDILQGRYSWQTRKIMRPISLYLTKPLIRVHPNIITSIMALLGFISLPFFILGGYSNVIIGAIILEIYYFFDHIDGDIARAAHKESLRGKYLDFIPNITVNPLVLIALGYGLFRTSGSINYFLFGVSAGFFYIAKEPARLFKYLVFKKLKIKNKSDTNQTPILLAKLNVYSFEIIDYPGIMNLLLIFAIFNITHYLVIFYGIIIPLYFIARVTYEFYFFKNIDFGKK
jgi:phosphatidylserine synthase